ncbi:MAG: FxsA family protein [Tindallia sp. MSAO_Bac2]|nr:MAG: FxsA family protein [Tindallia sp. MSAO_Bac2]
MLFKLIILFTTIPIIELMILLRINQYIGFGYTILLVFLTGVAGAFMAKQQGRGILKRIKGDMRQGRMPGDELVNGLCVLIGGALLLTPGIITDIAGFSLVIPATRQGLKQGIKRKMKQMIREGSVHVHYDKEW